jgi:hypothetical protein
MKREGAAMSIQGNPQCAVLLACLLLVVGAHAQGLPATSNAPSATQRSGPELRQRPPHDPSEIMAPRPVMINGRPYGRPTQHQLFIDYLNDSYGLPAMVRTTVRTAYNQALDQPKGWGTDTAGFGQRFGSNVAVTAINGNVRYGMEEIFHEDLRYIPCHGCSIKHKIENALLAEITARHDSDGHRFFTLTPTIADFSGPIVAHTLWYPGGLNPFGGVVATRTVFATRVGAHLFREFILERNHKDKPEPQ